MSKRKTQTFLEVDLVGKQFLQPSHQNCDNANFAKQLKRLISFRFTFVLQHSVKTCFFSDPCIKVVILQRTPKMSLWLNYLQTQIDLSPQLKFGYLRSMCQTKTFHLYRRIRLNTRNFLSSPQNCGNPNTPSLLLNWTCLHYQTHLCPYLVFQSYLPRCQSFRLFGKI